MPAKNRYHNIVKNALIKEGWIITHDPYTVHADEVKIDIDLGAEYLLAAEKSEHKIAVEIKSFIKPSRLHEFHAVLGQFINYRRLLRKKEPRRVLYLAVPADVYTTFFQLAFTKEAVKENKLKLIAYNLLEEAIISWQE